MGEHFGSFLIVERGAPFSRGDIILLNRERLIIGRSWENWTPHVSFSSMYVSREQAAVEYCDNHYTISNLSSRQNQFFLNKKNLEKGDIQVLHHGDVISFANDGIELFFCKGMEPGETIELTPKNRRISVFFDDKNLKFYVFGKEIELTGKCYLLFRLLCENKGRAISHEFIKQSVWPERGRGVDGLQQVTDEEVVTVVHRLKERLGSYENLIENIRGYGYILNENRINEK